MNILWLNHYSRKEKESAKVNRRNKFIRAYKEDIKYLGPKSIGLFIEFSLCITFVNKDTICDCRTIYAGSNYTFRSH